MARSKRTLRQFRRSKTQEDMMGIIDRIRKARQRNKEVREKQQHYQQHGFNRKEARRAAEDTQRKQEKEKEYNTHYEKIKSFRGKKEADEWGRQWKKKEAAKDRKESRKRKGGGRSGGGIGFGGPGFGGGGRSGGGRSRGGGGTSWGKGPF
jgi:hypothetical protein